MTNITIPNNVTSIYKSAFSKCSSLTEVVIPDSVTSIDGYAFSNCSNLTTVYYNGTEEDWGNISINYDNNCLLNATRYYYSETEPALNAEGTAYDGNYWYYNENGEPTVWVKEN